jgi:hypothetical protein
MFTNSPQTNVPYFLSPVGNGKQDTVCKHVINPLCTTSEANAENILKLIEDLHSLSCLWDIQTAEYKNCNKKSDAHNTLAKNYVVSAVEIKKKI